MNFAAFDLNLLKLLDALLRDRSTTVAGRRVGLSQPAVSSALGRLRHALNDPLFVRRGNALVPTPFAETLEAPVRETLERLEASLNGASFDPRIASRTFRLFGADYLSATLLPTLIADLLRDAPFMRVSLVHHDTDLVVPGLASAALDFALMPRCEMPRWVSDERAFGVDSRVVARRGHPATQGIHTEETMPLDLFCDLPQVVFSPSGSLVASSAAEVDLHAMGRSTNIVATVPHFHGIASIVAASDLISVMPAHFARRIATAFDLDVFDVPYRRPDCDVCLFWHERNSSSHEHRWMRERMLAILAPPIVSSAQLTWG